MRHYIRMGSAFLVWPLCAPATWAAEALPSAPLASKRLLATMIFGLCWWLGAGVCAAFLNEKPIRPRHLPAGFRKALFHILPAMTGLLLLGLYAWPREHLVPYGSDHIRAQYYLGGDEPTYLLTAQALARGEGENVAPAMRAQTWTNYSGRAVVAPEAFTWAYYRDYVGLRPWLDRRAAWGDAMVFPRQILLPALCAPLALRPEGVRWSVLCVQSFLLALTVVATLHMLGASGLSERWTHAALCVFLLGGLPVSYYTAQIFPEIVAGCMLLSAMALFTRPDPGRTLAGIVLLFAGLLGTARLLGAVLLTLSLLVFRAWRERRWREITVILLLGCAYITYNLWLWGTPWPPAANPRAPFSFASFWVHLPGAFFSDRIGLLFLNPAVATGLAALILLPIYSRTRSTSLALAPVVGYLALVSAFPDYRGGSCAAGRYQVLVVFMMITPLTLALRHVAPPWRARLLTSLWALGLPGLLLALWVGAWPATWFQPFLPWLTFPSARPLGAWLPGLYDGGASLWRIAAWTLFFAATLFLPDAGRKLLTILRKK